MKLLLALAVLLSLAAPRPTERDKSAAAKSCIPVATLVTPAAFHKYATSAIWRGPWHKPDVQSGVAHLYRTVVRSEAVGPPDFAGQYKVVRLGCGAGLTCPLIADLKTGKILFVPALGSVAGSLSIAEIPGIDDPRLVYRADSRLLVAVGARNEKERLTGATLFEMRHDHLHLIRFI